MTDTPPSAADPLPPTSTPSQPDPTGAPSPHPTGRTRISGTWVGVIIATLILVLLLVFILQNSKSVKVSYFTVNGTMPLGVALLLATIGGVLFAGVVASLRIWQLRHRLNKSGQTVGRRRSTPPA
jgi:uncharacterized integral membrane protein